MRRSLHIFLISIITLFYVSCGDTGTDTEEPVPHDFTTAPSEELSQIIEDTPSDFTWGFYNDNIEITLHDDPQWDGELVISGFQVQNGEIVNEMTSEAVETNADELSAGISTEELLPSSNWFPGEMWVSTEEILPSSNWFPGEMWAPSEMQDVAMSQNDLAEDQTLVVVYAHVPLESAERQQVTRPFGIIFQQRQPTTGTLEAITTTSGGSDDSGYTLLVDGANETAMDTADTASVGGLDEGTHQAELTDIPSDCSVDGDNPRDVSITAGETISTTFEVSCQTKLNSRLVFHSQRDGNAEIYVMDDDGSNQERLTDNSTIDSSPVISNDGSQIAFVSGRNGEQELFIMNADGSNPQQVTTATTDPGFHSWSADDSQLAFAWYTEGGRDIFKVNTDGTNRTQLTNSSSDDAFPTWSPDGNTIAFASDRNGNDFEYDIFTMDTDGSNIQQITSNIPLNSYAPAPRWSPDGSQLVFATESGAIIKVDSDGSNPQQVTDDTAMDRTPTWSSDGSEIAFERNDDIYKISADGSGSATQLTTDPDSDIEPFWSPIE